MTDTDIEDDIDDELDAAGRDSWLDGDSDDPLANVLLDMAEAWARLDLLDGPLRAAMVAQAKAWLVGHHARLSPAASWAVLTEVFGSAGVAQALLGEEGCPLAALLAQSRAHFADPPRQWDLGPAILGLADAQRDALIAYGFPLQAICTEKRSATKILGLVLTTDHTWILDLWKATNRRHPVFAYWSATHSLHLPHTRLSRQGAVLVAEALDLMCAGKDTKEIRMMAFKSPFDNRIWAAGVAHSIGMGHKPLFPLKGCPGTMGLVTSHLGWLFDPNPTAHQLLERQHRLAKGLPATDILRMDDKHGRIDLDLVFPRT